MAAQEKRLLRVVHTIAGLWEGIGGPATSVPGLCAALARAGLDVVLVTGRGRMGPGVVALSGLVDVKLVRLGPYALGHAGPWFSRELERVVGSADVIHGHGLWLHPNWVTAGLAKRNRKPLVISPRGMLEPSALSRHQVLKEALWRVRDSWSVSAASAIHATSVGEANAIRDRGVRTPIAVISNGVDLEDEFSEAKIDMARASASDDGCRRVVVLSRLHAHKGIRELLLAWKTLALEPGVAELLVAGWGEEGYWQALLRETGLTSDPSVRFLGPVSGDRKLTLLARSWVLVLPSRSENYGLAVAEALACRAPAIATTGSPWEGLPEAGCGWWVAPRPEALAEALLSALGLTAEAQRAMGARGRKLVEAEHSQVTSARRMKELYAWVMGGISRPPFVLEGAS